MSLRCYTCNMEVGEGHFDLYHRCWKCKERLPEPHDVCGRCGEGQNPPISPELVLEMRSYECLVRGHSWDIIEGYAGPVSVLCTHCGADSGLRKGAPE